MLTLGTIECSPGDAGATGAAADYALSLDDGSAAFSRTTYTLGKGDGHAVWHGPDGALGQLGVKGGTRVERDALVATLEGRHAVSGVQVRRPGRRGDEAVVKSVDLTFSVPKSVSVLWSQASPAERQRIEADVLDAARATVDFMATRQAAVHRRTQEGRVRDPALGAAAALSMHVTARRAAADVAPAPQLHVHSLVVGLLRSDGRLVSPDPWNWYRHGAAREGGAYGRAVLADRLRARGYEIETATGQHGRYFELRGIPAPLRDALSGRTREVQLRARALELALGRPVTGAATSVLAKETRQRKTDQPAAEITTWWDAVASEHGFDLQAAEALRSRGPQRVEDHDARAVATAILERIREDGPTVSSGALRAIAFEASAGYVNPDEALEILERLVDAGQIIRLEHDRATTVSIRTLERRALRSAVDAGARLDEPLPGEMIEAGIERAEGALPGPFDAEQRAAVDAICAGAGWTNLTGRAGTGKGAALEAVAHAHRDAGWQVLATAVDGTTAQRLAAQVHSAGYTLDGLHNRIALGKLRADGRTLVIVDEASKVDTARWAELCALSDRDGVRVLAVGDTGQLDAVELSGLFEEIVRRTPTVELQEVRRHRDPAEPSRPHPWLDRYQAAVHESRGFEAVTLLREHDAIRLHDTRADALAGLVTDWDSWRHDHAPDQTLLIVHGSNDDVDTANVVAQRMRLDAGELGDAAVPAPDRDYELRVGDQAVVRTAPLYLPEGGRLENGTALRITGLDPAADTIDVVWNDPTTGEREATLDLSPLRQRFPGVRQPALRLAYAQHPNPAQGVTVDRTASLGNPIADRRAVYVADTRSRYGHTVHLAREDLGTDGTDEDRLARYAETISNARSRHASLHYKRLRERDGLHRGA